MTDDVETFRDMARQFPVRTGLLTVAPVVLALTQVVNAAVTGGPLVASVGFATVLVAVVTQLTRWQLATYRRRRLVEELPEQPLSGD